MKRLLISDLGYLRLVLFIYYTVGVLGLSWSYSRLLFIGLIPYSLIITAILLFLVHNYIPSYNQRLLLFWKNRFDRKNLTIKSFLNPVFVCLCVLVFLIEVIGVATGKIFGVYSYGYALGWKLLKVPILIGVNWLMLMYCAWEIISRINNQRWIRVCLSATILLGYDYVMEPVAPKLSMWYWQNNTIPLQNFIAWYGIALIMGLCFEQIKWNYRNGLSTSVLLLQILFFTILNFIL